MAIIACKECGHQVSDKAAGCPNCGAPIAVEAKPKAHAKRIVYGVLIALGVACLIAAGLWRIETPDRLMGMMRSLGHIAEHSLSAGPPLSAERSSIAVQSSPAPAAAPSLAPAAAPPLVYQTTAQQLYQDYDTNAVAAQNRIGTSRVRITGSVAEIDEDAGGHPIVKLWTSNGGSAEMTLNDDQKAAAAQLIKGETVDVQCDRMRHVVASPQGSGCALVLVDAASGQAYLAVFLSTVRGNAPIYIAGPMSRAECLARGDDISAQLSPNLKRDRVLSKNCAPTARENIPPEGCRLSSSMSAMPDMPTVHLWKYDCATPAAASRGSAATAAALHKAVPSIEVTNLAAAPEESADPEAQSTAALSQPGAAIAATPTPAAAALQSATLPSTAAVAAGDAATVQQTVSTAPKVSVQAAAAPKVSVEAAAAAAPKVSVEAAAATAPKVSTEAAATTAPKVGDEPAVATAPKASAESAGAAPAPNVGGVSTAAATASNVTTEATVDAAPSDLLIVRTADPGAADHIASYCKGASAASTDRDAVAAGCRREEVGAWTRLVLHHEFPALDEATRRKCNEPPFPDSYVAKESCARYELRIN